MADKVKDQASQNKAAPIEVENDENFSHLQKMNDDGVEYEPSDSSDNDEV